MVGGNVNRGTLLNNGTLQSITFDNSLTAAWVKDNFDNTVQLGFDYQWFRNKWLNQPWLLSGIGLGPVNPFDGHFQAGPEDSELGAWNAGAKKQQLGFYSQAQTIWNETILAKLGLRYDTFDVDTSANSTANSNKVATSATNGSLTDNHISWNAGLMYLSPWGISPYVTYSEAFYADAALRSMGSINGTSIYGTYKPVKTHQIETGLKITPDWLKGYMNLAWYQIKQDNPTLTVVTNTGALDTQQTNKRKSQGIELHLNTEIIKNLQMDITYAYIDAKNIANNGDRTKVDLLPRHTATAWLSYNFSQFGIPQLTLGAGARYQGSNSDDNVTDVDGIKKRFRIPSATVFDLAASYQFDKHWRAQLNVNNLTDKYYLTGSSWGVAYLGEGRIIRGTLSYDF